MLLGSSADSSVSERKDPGPTCPGISREAAGPWRKLHVASCPHGRGPSLLTAEKTSSGLELSFLYLSPDTLADDHGIRR